MELFLIVSGILILILWFDEIMERKHEEKMLEYTIKKGEKNQ